MNICTPTAPAEIDVGQVAMQSRSYWSTVLQRLSRDRFTLFFGGLVLLIILSAVLADVLAPYDPHKASMIKRLKPVGTPTDDEPIALTTVEETQLWDPQGNPYITGWVRNDDDRNARVYGTPIFYDGQGHPLERTYAIVAEEGGVLEPGDTAAFQIVISEGWDGSTYSLQWNGNVTGESPRTGLATEYVEQEAGQIKGHLRNTSGDVEDYLLVYGLFYDANDQLIGIRTNGEFIRELSPGESEGFTIDFPSQVAAEDVAGYELIVE